jgi:hypothetical protein
VIRARNTGVCSRRSATRRSAGDASKALRNSATSTWHSGSAGAVTGRGSVGSCHIQPAGERVTEAELHVGDEARQRHAEVGRRGRRGAAAQAVEHRRAAIHLAADDAHVVSQRARLAAIAVQRAFEFDGRRADGAERRRQFVRGTGAQRKERGPPLASCRGGARLRQLAFALLQRFRNAADEVGDERRGGGQRHPHAVEVQGQDAAAGTGLPEVERPVVPEGESVGDVRDQGHADGPSMAQGDGGHRDAHQVDDAEWVQRSAHQVEHAGQQARIQQERATHHAAAGCRGPQFENERRVGSGHGCQQPGQRQGRQPDAPDDRGRPGGCSQRHQRHPAQPDEPRDDHVRRLFPAGQEGGVHTQWKG